MSELQNTPLSSVNETVPVMLATTYDYTSMTSWRFDVNVKFVQKFRVQQTGIPNGLYIRMGSNQKHYGGRIRFMRDDTVIYKKDYTNVVQRPSDWTTEFLLPNFPFALIAGEWVSFEVSVSSQTAIEPLFDELPDYPKDYLGPIHTEFGKMAARFFLVGTIDQIPQEENPET